MNTKDELNNAIRTRLNELIHTLSVSTHSFRGNSLRCEHCGCDTVSVSWGKECTNKYKVPPELQEVLLAIRKVRPDYTTKLRIEIGGAMYFTCDGEKYKKNLIFCTYDMALTLQDQSIETLQAIYDLLI